MHFSYNNCIVQPVFVDINWRIAKYDHITRVRKNKDIIDAFDVAASKTAKKWPCITLTKRANNSGEELCKRCNGLLSSQIYGHADMSRLI